MSGNVHIQLLNVLLLRKNRSSLFFVGYLKFFMWIFKILELWIIVAWALLQILARAVFISLLFPLCRGLVHFEENELQETPCFAGDLTKSF